MSDPYASMKERLKASKAAQEAERIPAFDEEASHGDMRTSQGEVRSDGHEDEGIAIERNENSEVRTSQIDSFLGDIRSSDVEEITSNKDERIEHSEARTDKIAKRSAHREVISSKLAVRHRGGRAATHDVRSSEIDLDLLDQAIALGEKNPKVTIYSPVASKVLQYLGLTVVKYSMSNDMRDGLETAVMERYPNLYKAVLRREKGK
jgi:hypothetical protein